jgi:hypothetical protein
MKTKASLPFVQDPTTGPYPEPHESSLHPPIYVFVSQVISSPQVFSHVCYICPAHSYIIKKGCVGNIF